jgi:ABC-type transport system substrate-binding protein
MMFQNPYGSLNPHVTVEEAFADPQHPYTRTQFAAAPKIGDAGRVTVDPMKREAIYKAFVDRAIETSPFVYLMWRDQSFGVASKIKGFRDMPGFLSFQSGLTPGDTTIE